LLRNTCFEPIFQLGSSGHSNEAIYHLATLEEQQSWDALNAVVLSGLGVIVDVDFTNLDPACVLNSKLFDQWSDLATRATPGCPEVN
jgi:hypothetical protein